MAEGTEILYSLVALPLPLNVFTNFSYLILVFRAKPIQQVYFPFS